MSIPPRCIGSRIYDTIKKLNSSGPRLDDFPFRAIQKPSYSVVLLHTVPSLAATIMVWLNVYEYWIGKELSGVYNSNGPKQLALQLTAKLHELLMLASLSEVLLSNILGRLAFGHGLPFGSLMAVTRFKDPSYVCSREFRAMYNTEYQHKSLFVSLILVSTMLGVTVGPSSATLLIPRLDDWPSGEAIMTLDTSDNLLWPSDFGTTALGSGECGNSSLGCFSQSTWNSLAATLLPYWEYELVDGTVTLPQYVNIPSTSSLRSMDIRVGIASRYSGTTFTAVTIQHAVIADLVNSFRFLTFPSRSAKCNKTWSSAMCSYQDFSWISDAAQPAVLTACLENRIDDSATRFPIISSVSTLSSAPYVIPKQILSTSKPPQFTWVTGDDARSLHASIGVVMRLDTLEGKSDFACSVVANWINSTTLTSYKSGNYVIRSGTSELDLPMLIDKELNGQTVSIDSEWAQHLLDSDGPTQNNTTLFQEFLQLGHPANDISRKVETTLSVLFAEKMAHSGAGAKALSVSSKNLNLKVYGGLTNQSSLIAEATPQPGQVGFGLRTSMTGYGYGLRTTSGLSISTLTAIIILCVYSTVAISHLISLYTSSNPYILSWREQGDILVTCLRSKLIHRYHRLGRDESGNDLEEQEESERILSDIVLFTSKRRRPELCFRHENLLDKA